MASFLEAFRQGRNEARAARGAPPLPARRHAAPALLEPATDSMEYREQPGDREREREEWADEPPVEAAAPNPAGVDLEAALQARDRELADAKQLIAELKDYAEQLQDRVVELIAGAEPMAKALRLPGVKTYLLQKFHPDKYPEADDKQRELLTAALKTISAAYTVAASELHTPE
jgi:hypothetical protein